MSLLDQLKKKFANRQAAEDNAADAVPAQEGAPNAEDPEVDQLLNQIDQRLAQPEAEVPAGPTEVVDESGASQLAQDASVFGEESTGLPLIGRRPVFEQQRLLLGLIGGGAAIFV